MHRRLGWSTSVFLLGFLSLPALATPPDGAWWRYYRPGNTGVMGDYSDALWIAPNGTPYVGGYDPFFEEGGFSRYVAAENRWENYSNVDYPVIGSSANLGAARVSDFAPDAEGGVWMGTWRGALYFDPTVGPASLARYDPENSPMLGGRTMDVSVAPDGSVWFACYGNGGGLVRYRPGTSQWTVWTYGTSSNGWPGWTTTSSAAVQPKPAGGYFVWIDDAFGIARYDSETDQFTVLPQTGAPGEIVSIPHDDACDDAGNVWMVRRAAGSSTSLDYRRSDGVWVVPPQQFPNGQSYHPFRAFGDGEALFVDSGGRAWHFDGSSWLDYGVWRAGGFTYGVDIDAAGNVWVSGNGGAGRRDAETGTWQRHRLTNNGQMDNWVRDLALAPNGDVWFTCNGSPGIGGIGVFDGQRWHLHNASTYGLGEEWPFPTDNADAIAYRPTSGHVVLNPMFNGIHEWDGSGYVTLESGGESEGLAEDSLGRLWTVGNYFSLRYHDGSGFQSVPIVGWGTNLAVDPDRAGTVWACANGEVVRTDGSYRYSRQTPDLPELNPLHDVLMRVAVGRDGVAWLGTTEGLFRLDAETGTHEWYHRSNSPLPIDQVEPLVVSPDGLVWMTNFGTSGVDASLLWFDGTEFGSFGAAEGLPHAQIYDAEVRDVPGGYEIWLACASRGIAVLTVPTADPTGIAVASSPQPGVRLASHPNPFVDRTSLSFELPATGHATLRVYDVAGRLVRTLADGLVPGGRTAVGWDGRDAAGLAVAPGVYLVRLQSEFATATRKVVRVN